MTPKIPSPDETEKVIFTWWYSRPKIEDCDLYKMENRISLANFLNNKLKEYNET